MIIQNKNLTNKVLTVGENISADRTIYLDVNGLVEIKGKKQAEALLSVPDFIEYKGSEKIQPRPIVQVEAGTPDNTSDAADELKRALNAVKNENAGLLEKISVLEKSNPEAGHLNEMEIRVAELEAENAELKEQLSVTADKTPGDGEGDGKNDDENKDEPTEGDTKIEDEKAYVYSENKAGSLQWLRDPQNDPEE